MSTTPLFTTLFYFIGTLQVQKLCSPLDLDDTRGAGRTGALIGPDLPCIIHSCCCQMDTPIFETFVIVKSIEICTSVCPWIEVSIHGLEWKRWEQVKIINVFFDFFVFNYKGNVLLCNDIMKGLKESFQTLLTILSVIYSHSNTT